MNWDSYSRFRYTTVLSSVLQEMDTDMLLVYEKHYPQGGKHIAVDHHLYDDSTGLR